METLVVIPYLSIEARGRELELAVAGWQRHFKEPFRLVVVGDLDATVEACHGIDFIPCPRVPDVGVGNYRPHIDHVHKFRTVREHYSDAAGFIYTCDDIFAVNDFTMDDVLVPKIRTALMGGDSKSMNGWQRDMAKTRMLCEREGLPLRNWVCHLPVYYQWDALFSVYDKYDCDHSSYIVENIYFNMFFSDADAVEVEGLDKYKYVASTTRTDASAVRRAMREKIWLNANPDGFTREFERLLRDYYELV